MSSPDKLIWRGFVSAYDEHSSEVVTGFVEIHANEEDMRVLAQKALANKTGKSCVGPLTARRLEAKA